MSLISRIRNFMNPAKQSVASLKRSNGGRFGIRASSYDVTRNGRRMKSYHPSSIGPNSGLFEDLDRLRDFSRDSVRKNPYAESIISTWVRNAIGTGIKPVPQHSSEKIREKIIKAFAHWVKYADFDGNLDWWGMQALAFRSIMESGEGFSRFRSKSKGNIPFTTELFESDHLPTMGTFSDVKEGNKVRMGIELDKEGSKVAYHILETHPNEIYFDGYSSKTIRVPADEIVHTFKMLRPKQLRGEPWLTRILVRLIELDKYDDAELARKVLASSLTGFITSSADDDNRPLASISPDGADTVGDNPGTQSIELNPGTFIDLDSDESVTLAEVDDVGGMYDVFMATQLRAIAIGAGITYEQLTGDLSNVNYSSLRGGLLEFRRECEQVQYSMFVFQYCEPHWRQFLRMAAFSGMIDLRDYLANKEEYESVEWITPGWDWVDPVKDITAKVLEMQHGLTSRARTIASRGEDMGQIDRENEADLKTRERLKYGESETSVKEKKSEPDDESPKPKKKAEIENAVVQ